MNKPSHQNFVLCTPTMGRLDTWGVDGTGIRLLPASLEYVEHVGQKLRSPFNEVTCGMLHHTTEVKLVEMLIRSQRIHSSIHIRKFRWVLDSQALELGGIVTIGFDDGFGLNIVEVAEVAVVEEPLGEEENEALPLDYFAAGTDEEEEEGLDEQEPALSKKKGESDWFERELLRVLNESGHAALADIRHIALAEEEEIQFSDSDTSQEQGEDGDDGSARKRRKLPEVPAAVVPVSALPHVLADRRKQALEIDTDDIDTLLVALNFRLTVRGAVIDLTTSKQVGQIKGMGISYLKMICNLEGHGNKCACVLKGEARHIQAESALVKWLAAGMSMVAADHSLIARALEREFRQKARAV